MSVEFEWDASRYIFRWGNLFPTTLHPIFRSLAHTNFLTRYIPHKLSHRVMEVGKSLSLHKIVLIGSIPIVILGCLYQSRRLRHRYSRVSQPLESPEVAKKEMLALFRDRSKSPCVSQVHLQILLTKAKSANLNLPIEGDYVGIIRQLKILIPQNAGKLLQVCTDFESICSKMSQDIRDNTLKSRVIAEIESLQLSVRDLIELDLYKYHSMHTNLIKDYEQLQKNMELDKLLKLLIGLNEFWTLTITYELTINKYHVLPEIKQSLFAFLKKLNPEAEIRNGESFVYTRSPLEMNDNGVNPLASLFNRNNIVHSTFLALQVSTMQKVLFILNKKFDEGRIENLEQFLELNLRVFIKFAESGPTAAACFTRLQHEDNKELLVFLQTIAQNSQTERIEHTPHPPSEEEKKLN